MKTKKSAQAYILETKLGPMAVLVSQRSLLASHLPCESREQLQELVRTTWKKPLETEPSEFVRELEARVAGLWSGTKDRFEDIDVDVSSLSPFCQSVYCELRRVSPGHVVTYSELAERLGKKGGARAVGRALSKNPLPLFLPCHRVLAKSGLGGFTAPGGLSQKYLLLEAESTGANSWRVRDRII